jgi:NAD(P)-dependent dehydrogenase (short-subunit alcohol dehydrogenase family)
MTSTSTARYASLQNRAVLITGGASGIGAHYVREFAAQGARVTFLDIDAKAADALIAQVPQARFIACDVTDIAALREAVTAAGEVEVLINNAARDDRHALDEVEPEYWRRTLALNLDHQFFATQAVIPQMRARRAGCIIMMGSISWMRARGGMVGYTAAKAAINGMTRTLARELGEHGIRVNSVVPGAINTERQASLWRSPEIDRQIMENQALKVALDGSHVARMGLFLASDEASGLTGQNFLVDAGMTLN